MTPTPPAPTPEPIGKQALHPLNPTPGAYKEPSIYSIYSIHLVKVRTHWMVA